MILGTVYSWIFVENFLLHSKTLETYNIFVFSLCFPMGKYIHNVLDLLSNYLLCVLYKNAK